MTDTGTTLNELVGRIRACRICRDAPRHGPLPHEPRPVIQVAGPARILIAGQAPGTRVHASGRPFTDPSGDRLRNWLGIGPEIFYDPERLAIVPMGFCFPGLSSAGADLPPRPECAPAWRSAVMAELRQIRLIVVLGLPAMRWHLGNEFPGSLLQSVAAWRDTLQRTPPLMALPHPSWRNNAWLKRNPWLESEVLPELRRAVERALE